MKIRCFPDNQFFFFKNLVSIFFLQILIKKMFFLVFDTSLSLLVPEIEGGYPERHGEGEEEGAEGLVLE